MPSNLVLLDVALCFVRVKIHAITGGIPSAAPLTNKECYPGCRVQQDSARCCIMRVSASVTCLAMSAVEFVLFEVGGGISA